MARTLLLDLDGTLVDTVPDLMAALNRLLRSRNLPALDRAPVASMVGDGVAALVSRGFSAYGRQPDPSAVADFTADYEVNVAVESTAFPGALAALSALAACGWRLAVCTNKPERAARALLDRMGLMPAICTIGGGDSFAVRKPDPGHLLATLALADGTPDRAIMVGDHHNDVVAAGRAGMASIYADWGYGTVDMAVGGTAVAASLADVVAIANRLRP